ncbi:hypothetical protein NEOLEDRAFT_489408 [Neolentinus lepideus HHB14362 ss-1]|uniref:Uncharacterized protein n=1 Tax=Neolentinus lepideus HHB14362 ss-1 TaxID=1314782 RepID=A0A165VNM5_9AGAM|nr:hypothetical protein NEOLEDRAFT_489408 [Neolentinus lepideus HHB14362 ss-1]
MLRQGALCFVIYSLVSQVQSFIILNPSPSLYWISNNTNNNGVAYSGINYLRFLRNETDPVDEDVAAVLVNTTGAPVDFWAYYTSGLIRGPPGVYRTDVISPGQWDVFVGENALTGTYTIALVNITAWASSYDTPLDSSIVSHIP